LIIALFAVNDAHDLIRTCAPCTGQSADVKFSNPRRNSKKITGNGQEWQEKRTLKNLLNESASSTTSVKLEKWPFCPPSKLLKKCYPQNIRHNPVVKFLSRLDLERKFSFFKAPKCFDHDPVAIQADTVVNRYHLNSYEVNRSITFLVTRSTNGSPPFRPCTQPHVPAANTSPLSFFM
jgi:hypothetical protein